MNGFFPVDISYITTPNENRSLRPSMVSPRACSGDIYTAVPGITPTAVSELSAAASSSVPRWCTSLASPKSSTFTCPLGVRKMLAGLISRWTIPLACDAASASATWMLISRTGSRSIACPPIRCFKLWPSSFSITMKGWPLFSSMPWMVQILGWFNCEAARASRSNRSSALGSPVRLSGMNLRATCRPSLRSSAS